MAATGKVENEDLVAATLLQLTLAMPTWIARRSEALEILDNRVGRRRVSVEVDLDARVWSGVGKLAGPTLVPLAVLDRNKSSANFQVVDESGRKLARLNRSEERRLVFLGFCHLVKARLGFELDGDLRREIWLCALGSRSVDSLTDATGQLESIRNSSVLGRILEDFDRLYYLVAILPASSSKVLGQRRVLTYDFCHPMQEAGMGPPSGKPGTGGAEGTAFSRLRKHWSGVTSGDASRRWSCEVSGAGDCASYHVTLKAPEHLVIGTTWLEARLPVGTRSIDNLTLYDQDRLGVEGHVFAQIGRYVQQASFETELYPQPHGIIRSALWSTLFSCAVMVCGLFLVLFDAQRASPLEPSSGTALLLLVPGILAGIVARPLPTSTAATVLGGTHLLLGATSGMSFLAALSLSTGWNSWPNAAMWVLLTLGTAYLASRVLRQFETARSLSQQPPPTPDMNVNPIPTSSMVP